MGVAGQDDVDALHARGQLAVDVEAVVAQQHHEIDALGPHLGDVGPELVFLDAERPVGDHVARIGDRRVGKGLADHADPEAAALDHAVGLEHRIAPGRVLHVAGEERELQLLDQLLDPLGAVGELPVRGHGVRRERVHDFHHVGALVLQGRVAALPGVAAVEQQHLARPLGADRLDQRRHAVEPADPAVGLAPALRSRSRPAHRPRRCRARP